MTSGIVCVGNRFAERDALGPRVFDWLSKRPLPPDVMLVDGGLRGLDLLPIIEAWPRVVFVDACREPEIRELAPPLESALEPEGWDHGAGLVYLLRVLPRVCEAKPPTWRLLCAGGEPDEALVARVGARAISLATDGSWS